VSVVQRFCLYCHREGGEVKGCWREAEFVWEGRGLVTVKCLCKTDCHGSSYVPSGFLWYSQVEFRRGLIKSRNKHRPGTLCTKRWIEA
jgi:hypothetical protein